MIKIGIIKEEKVPVDHRVPITPAQAAQIQRDFPKVQIKVQSSSVRCYPDDDYRNEGIEIVSSVKDCDILMGVKEVPIPSLIEDKTYLFFSHTIKKQAYNRNLLRAVLDKKIRLIDYEALINEHGHRIVAFGRWAGIVGAYNAIWTYGKRYSLFAIKRVHDCFDFADLKSEYPKVKLPSIKIVVTGGGRVSKGAMEVLLAMNIKMVSPAAFIERVFDVPVFCQLNTRDYCKHKEGESFIRSSFYTSPEGYEGDFLKYAQVADVLIAGAYWDPSAPVLFEREDVLKNNFKIRIIADITCDIQGSIPSTLRSSTIDDPIYDYNPSEDIVELPLTDEANITVMAVDNLPCELSRDASESFGDELINNVFPYLVGEDILGTIAKATVTEMGSLSDKYDYLKAYVEGK
ncbi:NAD(P)-dependent oxidoreductase [Cyclobacteriaceae bacterium]|jgi:saccharopine dehydrogenase (NAD+, L-lysine-forming)|nr:NAD(P)-dependent oxidoreductase [Cyclobacteriaceae bacterium]|tara:strand:+ start:147 stop:1355 length:1209 start_codon:yes stop_codon:yes gene_type:complete